MLSNHIYFYLVLFIVTLTLPHQAYSMSIGEAENDKPIMSFLDLSHGMLKTYLDLKNILQSDASKLGFNQKREIQVIMSLVLLRLIELEKMKEERTVYWHLRQGR